MIKFSVIFLLSVAACLVLEAGPEPKPAGDLWVDASASGDGDGSTGKPFSTIQQAARVAVAGDTIHVRPGIYRERVMPERGGDPGQPIVYQSEVLHGAVLARMCGRHPGVMKAAGFFPPVWMTNFLPTPTMWMVEILTASRITGINSGNVRRIRLPV